jgi:hexosaminidase
VPEIEIPGHSLAALAAYPQLSCTGGPFSVPEAWGNPESIYCAGNEQTFKFLEDVLSEVADLFPGPYIHIGGDESLKDRWKLCTKCQARIKAEGPGITARCRCIPIFPQCCLIQAGAFQLFGILVMRG